jgi:recombination protein RecA
MADKIDLKEFKKAMAGLEKKFDNKTLIKDVKHANLIHRVTFDSPLLNYELGGSFVTGRIMQLFGPESSGKSTISTFMAGQLQKKLPDQPIVLYLDFEHTFDPDFAERLGLNEDEEHFVLVQPDVMEDGFEIAEALVKTGKVCMVIFDSEAAAPTRKQAESEYGQADFGIAALQMSKGLKKLNIQLSKFNTSMIVISQERDNQQMMSHAIVTTGGRALKFFASTRNRVTKIDTIEKDGETIGITMKVRNYKNKTGVMFREAEMKLLFDTGFDSKSEYLDFFIKLGIIVQGGAWFKSEKYDIKLNGKAEVQKWLDEHPKEFEEMRNTVDEMLSKQTAELDGNNQKPDEADADEAEEKKAVEDLASQALADDATASKEESPELDV